MLRNRKAQSTLEYVILVTAVIVVIITLLVNKDSLFRTKLNTTLNSTIGVMSDMQSRWSTSINAQ